MYEDILTKLFINLWNLLPCGIAGSRVQQDLEREDIFMYNQKFPRYIREHKVLLQRTQSAMLGAMRQTVTQGWGGVFSAGSLLCPGPCRLLGAAAVLWLQSGAGEAAASPSWHHSSACFISAPTAALGFVHLFLCSAALLAVCVTGKASLAILCTLCSVKRNGCDFLCNTSAECSSFWGRQAANPRQMLQHLFHSSPKKPADLLSGKCFQLNSLFY